MKYIIFDVRGAEAPVLFPESFNHAWVADSLKPLRPLSAGFVDLDGDGRPRCRGRSEGLGLKSRPGVDRELVAAHLAG